MKLEFPKNFYWGAATSAHQVEGNNHNDWTEWEVKNADRLSKESGGKYPPENYISGRACDHYNRFRDDFDIVKQLSHNAHRFSIEWSRVEPEEGKWDEKEIEHYREVIRALRERGIEPFVTLWHWTLPIWIRNKGGVLAKDFPEKFSRYAEKMTVQFPDIMFWMTLNEPTSVIANAYFKGIWPPQQKGILNTLRAYRSLAKAHNLAYTAIHRVNNSAEVGLGNILKYQEPYSNALLNKLIVKGANYFTNQYLYSLTKGRHDWLGIQYYFHERLKFNIKRTQTLFIELANENKEISDFGWEIYPEGIYHVLKDLKKYNKPIYVTENGLADAKDIYRADFIKEHLRYVHKAIFEGVDVRGYLHWSLLDNFEWHQGFWPRFGLVEVDYKTMERKVRQSALEYKEICDSNVLINLKSEIALR